MKSLNDEVSSNEVEVNAVKQYLVKDEKFHLLKQCQQEVFLATEMLPSIRKIINEVINVENLEKVKEEIIESLNKEGR